MLTRVTRRLAFSLVELVVVVVIIGVIAAMAVPRISRGSSGAADEVVRANLRVLRGAIDRYAAEHRGILPAATSDGTNAASTFKSFRNQIVNYTNAAGEFSTTPDPANFPFGPYLRSVPSAPLGPAEGDERVRVVESDSPIGGNTTPARAWKYSSVTGQIIFNYDGTSGDGVTTYDQF